MRCLTCLDIYIPSITTCLRLYTYAPRPGHGPETHRHRGARAPHGASSSMFLLPASKSRWRVAILVWAVQETLLSRIVESEECIAFRSGPDGCHISVDRKKKSEKITCKTTHHVWVRHTTSGRYLLWEPAHCSYIAFLFYLCAHFLYCHMFSLTKKAWHSPAYRIPSADGLDSAQ